MIPSEPNTTNGNLCISKPLQIPNPALVNASQYANVTTAQATKTANEPKLATLSTDLKCEEEWGAGAPIHTGKDEDYEEYPEGGVRAYLCVFGSFCGCMLSLGLINSLAVFQSYITSHQLAGTPASSAGWIFGIYAFMSFFCGIQVGPIFDAKGPKWLVAIGSLLILLTYLLLGFCNAYWHFILAFSIVGGVGTSLVFTSSIAAVSHWFSVERGRWTGLACAGGGVSGIIIPLALHALLPQIGWAWSTRVLGLMNVLLAICANLFIRGRLPAKPTTRASTMPNLVMFKDKTMLLAAIAVFFVDWGLFIPLGYLTSYALSVGIDQSLSYQLVAILNAGSCLGRYFPGYMADFLGRFNAMILAITVCLASTFGLWLPAGNNHILIIAFAAIFGFGSGSGISLVPVCVGQLCQTEEYARYYATCCTVMSFATLTGFPVAGAVIGACGGEYWGLIIFTGVSYTIGAAFFLAARITKTGWVLYAKF
ncbi:hypothetical protein H2198_008160 [Neophaeococcomyces mojaviensis]|uniref:Uncharacterized protein n=1 Tax=Neophaeococcomyces mojaviensis TaxID=3383035 RepID=A0ACC2ZXY5_9EURO|nr:hypothetical protein H2198_008160 [Knufia sp. JES_112]